MNLTRHIFYKLKVPILIFFFFTTPVTSGCLNIGPYIMEFERLKYNIAITTTDNQEDLLNLVRLRYHDIPKVLAVSNINSQLTLGADAGGQYTITEGSSFKGFGDIFSFLFNTRYEDKPTITYQPLHGDKFVTNILSQIPLDVLMLLYNSGWSVERIFRLCVQSINGIRNAATASGPTPKFAPQYKDFFVLIKLMRKLQQQDKMNFVYEPVNDKQAMVLSFSEDALDSPETLQIVDMLRLTPGKTDYPIVINVMDHDPDYVRISTRSVLGVYYYLAQSVDVPQNDIKDGRVVITRHHDGQPFDWNELFAEFFQIKSSQSEPSDAYVRINYRGSWFYIDDRDLESKSTFSLLNQIFAIQAGHIKVEKPTLTLPIGR
jgi:hypothetical protein